MMDMYTFDRAEEERPDSDRATPLQYIFNLVKKRRQMTNINNKHRSEEKVNQMMDMCSLQFVKMDMHESMTNINNKHRSKEKVNQKTYSDYLLRRTEELQKMTQMMHQCTFLMAEENLQNLVERMNTDNLQRSEEEWPDSDEMIHTDISDWLEEEWPDSDEMMDINKLRGAAERLVQKIHINTLRRTVNVMLESVQMMHLHNLLWVEKKFVETIHTKTLRWTVDEMLESVQMMHIHNLRGAEEKRVQMIHINTLRRTVKELLESVQMMDINNLRGAEEKLVEFLEVLDNKAAAIGDLLKWISEPGEQTLQGQAHQPSQEDAANGNINQLDWADEDEQAVINGCLTENVLWKAISYLKRQYCHCGINGFRDTHTQTFYEPPPAVQHIFERSVPYNHWVLSISPDENQDLVVFLVDSDQPIEPEKNLGLNLKEQLFKAHIPTSMSSKGSKLKVVCVQVQQQTNKIDCGVFVIAFLVQFLGEYKKCGNAREAVERLKKVHFIVDKMRNHLLQCLVKQIFTPFPHEIRKIEEKECPSIVIVWDDLDHEYETIYCTNDLVDYCSSFWGRVL